MKKFLKLAAPIAAIAATIALVAAKRKKKRVRRRPYATDIPVS